MKRRDQLKICMSKKRIVSTRFFFLDFFFPAGWASFCIEFRQSSGSGPASKCWQLPRERRSPGTARQLAAGGKSRVTLRGPDRRVRGLR